MRQGHLAYASAARTGLSGRSLEATVLKHCAIELHRAISDGSASADDVFLAALDRNRKAWAILLEEVRDESSHLPDQVRINMLRTAAFVFKRTAELADGGDRAGALILVQINRDLAAGLEGDPG